MYFYDKNLLLKQVSSIEEFKKKKNFLKLTLNFIENDKLNKYIPLDFSTSVNIDTKVVHRARVSMFFQGSWNNKLEYVSAFAAATGFKIKNNIFKIIRSQGCFSDLHCGIEFSSRQYPERMKIYLLMEDDCKKKINNRDVLNHFFKHLGFQGTKVVNESDRINCFSIDHYKNGNIKLKIYVDYIGKELPILRSFYKEINSEKVKRIFNILNKKFLAGSNRMIIGCYKIDKNGDRNDLRMVDMAIKGKNNVIYQVLKQIGDSKPENYFLFKDVNFSFLSIDLRGKMTVYYAPSHYKEYIRYI